MEMVSRQQIAPQVIAKVRSVADLHFDPKEGDRLFEDLRMGPSIRRSLALSLSRISTQQGGQTISGDEAERLHTVGESIDLVFRRANGRD
ncbi:MAG TPA: hypothetical protein VLV54_15330 [Thermoanaerobaculia bacterium]|nr:hypothetical protein [Thermoanaerobaculia bacterium]